MPSIRARACSIVTPPLIRATTCSQWELRVGLRLPVEEVHRRHDVVAAVGRLLPDEGDAVGVWIGDRLEQYAVDEAEDGAHGADAKRKRENGNRGETGRLQQRTQPEADIPG